MAATVGTATGGNQKTVNVSGTLSTVAVTLSSGETGGTQHTFVVLKNGTTNVGSCIVSSSTCNIAVSPNTFAAGDTVVLSVARTQGTQSRTATWTSTYSWGNSPIG